MREIVFGAARRTPIGAFGGRLSAFPAHELGAAAIRAALSDAGILPDAVEDAIIGQVLVAGAGMNPARQAARLAGLPDESTAAMVSQVCGSGLRAVALAAQQIGTGAASIVVAGGQESMTRAPHVASLRPARKLGDLELRETMLSDGLTDAFFGYPMGVTAENIVARYGITRADQDAFAFASHMRAAGATREGRFASEIVPLAIAARGETATMDTDEPIRPDTSLPALSRLKAAFADDGSVTAGNASGISDGAAALLLLDADSARERGVISIARFAGWAQAGVDPALMGLGPIPAIGKLLHRLDWRVEDVDLWEINEAFAAQSLAVITELDLPADRVNVSGGAIALGHPIGASGARILVTLLHELRHRQARRGIAALCIGGGMGIAVAVERD